MSSGDLPEAVLERLDETRRAFINKMIAATPFLVPAVASLTITSFTADEVAAQVVTTTVMTTTGPSIPANSSVGLVAAAAALVVTGVALLQRHRSKQAGEDTKE
jgi:DNA-binding MltR family transcriptional regulator